MWIFLSERFGEKYKYTELALIFVQKQYFTETNMFFLHLSGVGTPCVIQQEVVFKISIFFGYSETVSILYGYGNGCTLGL